VQGGDPERFLLFVRILLTTIPVAVALRANDFPSKNQARMRLGAGVRPGIFEGNS
jgi:hypothetical protein